MIDVIVNAESFFDERDYPPTGPPRCAEPCNVSAEQQYPFQPLLLSRTEPRRPSRRRAGAQGTGPLLMGSGFPAPDAAPIHAQPPRHFGGAKAFLQQCKRSVSACFQFLRTAVRSHPSTSHVGHYLYSLY